MWGACDETTAFLTDGGGRAFQEAVGPRFLIPIGARADSALTLPTRAENQLCRHFGGHALTRSRTGAAHLGALLDHLIVSSYLHAAVGALPANLSTKPAHSFVKR